MAIRNTALRKIIRADLDGHTITREDTNVELTHLTGDVRDDLVVIFELHPKHRVGQGIDDFAVKLEGVFFRHTR